jgi:predicted metal-binding protein
MGYRIYVGLVEKNDLQEHLKKEFTDTNEDFDEKLSFFYNSRKTELNNQTDIRQFNIVKGYENEEYPPYIVTKEDFQKILDYYKKFLMEDFKEKELMLSKIKSKEDIDVREISSLNVHFCYLSNYFKNLIKFNENISEDGLFLLDYFCLVKIYENWKDSEIGIITHG